MISYCGDCKDAMFDPLGQHWYCRRTNVILCISSKWPDSIQDKANLDELECYLEEISND